MTQKNATAQSAIPFYGYRIAAAPLSVPPDLTSAAGKYYDLMTMTLSIRSVPCLLLLLAAMDSTRRLLFAVVEQMNA